MLFISSAPMQLRTVHVLVITHPQCFKSPAVEQALSMVSYQSKQVIRAGEHMLTQGRMNSFESIIIPEVDDKYWLDMLMRLMQHYRTIMYHYGHLRARQLIVYGNACKMLPKQILKIPKTKILRRADILRGPGLGLLPIQLDMGFDPQNLSKAYRTELERFSIQQPIYLFDNTVMYSPSIGIRNGSVYKIHKQKITRLAELKLPRNQEEREAFNEREIPPIRAIYDKDTPTKKQQIDEVSKTESTEKEVVPPVKE